MGLPEGAPARLGRYELIARLAAGGMGEIFLARLEGAAGFEKLFVIKRILPHLADDVRFRGMLIAEARIASVMAHPNVCQVYELEETDGQLYIVMEYLEGITMLPLLHRLSKEGRSLELGFVGGVIQQAIEGLHYAHELKDRSGEYLGIVHRDVTPSNIFLTDAGIAKVLDFGIAKVKDASAHTQTGTVKGKYAYMAPEQLRGASVDRRADVFALGIVLFEMLALRRLFQRKTDYLTFRAVMEQPIPDVRHYRPECPPALAMALARALDRDPTKRFATARQLGTAVLDAIAPIQRLWTQAEIGDFVTANFADDIEKRGAQIATAVLSPGTAAAAAMPVIVRPDEELEGSTENEFPPVDSAVSERPLPSSESSAAMPRATEQRGVDTSSATPLPTVMSLKRGMVWPAIAFAMLAVAGGALVLVWHQTQQQQQPRTVVFKNNGEGRIVANDAGLIEIEPPIARPTLGSGSANALGSSGPVDGSAASPSITGTGSGSGSTTATRRPAPPPSNQARDGAVVNRQKPQVIRCLTEHGKFPAGTALTIIVGANGRPKTVSIVPSDVDASPLGACIKAVFKAAVFPTTSADHEVEVTLS
jgi:serine/threonine protein kinase